MRIVWKPECYVFSRILSASLSMKESDFFNHICYFKSQLLSANDINVETASQNLMSVF